MAGSSVTLIVSMAAGEWDPEAHVMSSMDDKPVRVRGSVSMDDDGSCSSAVTGQPLLVKGHNSTLASQQASGCYMLPMEFSATSEQSVVGNHCCIALLLTR